MQRTVMDELFSEYEIQEALTGRLANEFGLELNEAEQYEFEGLFGKLKDLIKKGYNKSKKAIAVAQIVRALVSPNAVDVARHIEDNRNSYRNQPAIVQKAGYKDKPR